MPKLLVHRTAKTVHRPDCRWLAGANVKPAVYDDWDVNDLPEGARPCSYCAPPVPVRAPSRRAER